MFTHNNWILSDEFVQLIQSNDFYRQHVRWDARRFRPNDITVGEFNEENGMETSQTQVLHSINDENRTPTDNLQELSQRQQLQEQVIASNDEGEETAHTHSTIAFTKRKFDGNENSPERRTRTQPRRLKKN